MLTVNQDLNTRTIVVDGSGCILSLVFLEDGKHLLSGGQDGMIRQWRIEDAMEVGEAIKASGCVRAIALSSDRGWIISGEHSGATVWNRATRQKALAVNQHTDWVGTVDVSLDSTRFATGGLDKGVFIWDIATGTRLVGPLQHDNNLTAAKFAPSGDHIATTTWTAQSLRIYDAHTGELLRTVLVASSPTEPIAWSSDSQRIFAISSNVIRQIVVDTGAFEQIVPGELSPILPRHGRFLAGFVGNSLTFWDAFSGERFGPVFDQPGGRLRSIALSLDSSYLATGRSNGIINLRKLSDFIPISNAIGQTIVQQSSLQNQAEIEVLRGELRALGLRVGALLRISLPRHPTEHQPKSDNMTRQLAQSNHPPQAEVVPSLVSNGVYYIKSVIADVYLTFPQGATNTVVVQQWDQSNPAQRVRLHPAWFSSTFVNESYSGLFRMSPTTSTESWVATGIRTSS